MTMTATSAIAPVSTRPWAAPIDLAEAGRHQHFVSARCTRPWPNDSGRIQASTNQASLAARRLTVKTQTLPNAIGDEGSKLAGWESNSRSCPTQFEAVRDPTPPQANPPPPHCHLQHLVSEPVDPFLKNQLQHFSSRQRPSRSSGTAELIEHLTHAKRSFFFQVVSGAFLKVLTQSQFGEFHNLINGLVTRRGFDGAEHGLNRCEHIPNLFGILHAFVVKMNPKMFPSTLVHLVNHFAFEVAHVEKPGTLSMPPPQPP